MENAGNVKFNFVLKDHINEDDVSEVMKTAFTGSKSFFDNEVSITWITESECCKLDGDSLAKNCVFILEEFDGEVFEKLEKTKSLLLGPRCLLNCIMSNEFIPLGSTPVFTTAMRNLKICVTHLQPQEKLNIQKLVHWMGGYYSQNLNESCTHLVSDTVKSNKYENAASQNLKIMHPDWIENVWQISKSENVQAISERFDKYKLPTFFALNITTTGLRSNMKIQIKKLVEENGGIYNGSFKSGVTEILILEDNMFTSDKYKAAVMFKVDCLKVQWIFDSVEKGYATEMEKYRIIATKVSTPTKSNSKSQTSLFNDCSVLSEISYLVPTNLTINETCQSGGLNLSSKSSTHMLEYKKILKELNIAVVKKAGPFLDGCNIYLCGFDSDEKEKLKNILNVGSATRYDELNEKVTHIIVGEPIHSEIKYIKDKRNLARTIKLDWLVQCVKEKQPVDETNYLFYPKSLNVRDLECASPASKKNIESMSNTFKKPNIPVFNLDAPNTLKQNKVLETKENELLEQYLQKNLSTDNCTNLMETDDLTVDLDIIELLKNLKICIYGFENDDHYAIETQASECGANVVDEQFTGNVDYLILPTIFNPSREFNVIPYEIVNDMWLEDVINEKKIIKKEYYHEPINIDDEIKPLLNLSIVTSLYTGTERSYICVVAKALGANIEDAYAKKNRSILICAAAEGAKYQAAIKWKFPVVRSEWLQECAKQNCKASFDNYLLNNSSLGITTSSIPQIIEKSNIIEKPETPIEKNIINKPNEKKRQIFEEFKNIESPIRIPRLTALDQVTPELQIPSPKPINIEETLKTIETPIRNIIKRVLPNIKITPTTFTKVKFEDSPEEFYGFCDKSSASTRRKNKRCIKALEAFALPIKITSRPITPLSEIKKRFWKEALGEDYEEDTNVNTQFIHGRDDTDDGYENITVPSTAPNTEKNEPFLMLKNFIENREIQKQTYENSEEVDSIPFRIDSEMIIETQKDVGWRDPSEFNLSRRFRKKSEMQYKGTPKFIISCTADDQKTILEQQIKELKGEVCEASVRYNESVTHVICEMPNRGVKVLCSIAAGKWILGMKYIADSILAGYFLDEELYEWGNPKATTLPKVVTQNQDLANSAYRWRLKIMNDANMKSGVFTTFRVILHISKRDQFSNLITAGGGTVLNVKTPYTRSDLALSATHCFLDAKSELLRNDHKALAEAGVKVLKVIYLNDYITSENLPDCTKYMVDIK